MADIEIVNIIHGETAWYVHVNVYGVRREFKFDHEPTDADLSFAVGEIFRQEFPITDILGQETIRDA